jgi:hypothetical protein
VSDRAFRQLAYATKLVGADTMYFNQVSEWKAKRSTLLVQLADFSVLVQAHIGRQTQPYATNTRITLVDSAPSVRLANACEAAANGLYSVAEIAANFANKASRGAVPASFNALRKKCEQEPSSELARTLGDLQWYRKVRELRTEWAHYSSVFIAGGIGDAPVLCVRAYRRSSDQKEITSPNFSCTVDEFSNWIRAALATLDTFAGYVLHTWVLPTFRCEQTFVTPLLDSNGFPRIKADHRFEVETITIGEYLRRGGISCVG